MDKKGEHKHLITHKEFVRQKVLGINGLIQTDIDPRVTIERLTFVNDIDEVQNEKLKEYNIWYAGDSDELRNFYMRANIIDYNQNPIYNRNKRSYFWSVATTEGDIKTTHSGQPRNIVDTLTNVVGLPKIGVGAPDSVLKEIDDRLKEILDDNNFEYALMQKARPLTFVEGWGAWKINWDSEFRDTPILLYYRANSVDFIYKSGQLAAIIYRDYYQDEKAINYVLYETRRIEKRQTDTYGKVPCLVIEKELFRENGDSRVITPVEMKSLPQLKDVQPLVVVENFNRFLGYPNIYFEDSTGDCPGRSIFTGKIDLFDDEDQCHSQAANAVRRSTVHEYFNVQYLEKDEHTGMPKMPKDFDRKYIAYKGAKGGDGAVNGGGLPVQVTQPQINFEQYAVEERNILLNIIDGIMSPATLGIDIAKDQNADAQREKEKVTIFTRNTVMAEEKRALKAIANDLLCADELMHKGTLSCKKYDVYVQYEEFADASFEAKLETTLTGWQSGAMSDEMFIEYLYGNSISPEIRDRELKFMKDQRAASQQEMQQFDPAMFGDLGAENPYNDAMEKANIEDVQEDAGVPTLGEYDKIHDRDEMSDLEKSVKE